jgi:hypothetical protein
MQVRGRTVLAHALIATGVSADGKREIPGGGCDHIVQRQCAYRTRPRSEKLPVSSLFPAAFPAATPGLAGQL